MMNAILPPKKYEEFAFVLDFLPRGRSALIKGREGPIVQVIGEERLTLLELLATNDVTFEVSERVCIGKEGRTKVLSVLGKLNYEELTNQARNEVLEVVEEIIKSNEKKYVSYFNELQPITPRLHALELIPGIGKTFMRAIIDAREKRPFESFHDLQQRIGLRDPARLIAKRVIEELSGGSRVSLFVKK